MHYVWGVECNYVRNQSEQDMMSCILLILEASWRVQVNRNTGFCPKTIQPPTWLEKQCCHVEIAQLGHQDPVMGVCGLCKNVVVGFYRRSEWCWCFVVERSHLSIPACCIPSTVYLRRSRLSSFLFRALQTFYYLTCTREEILDCFSFTKNKNAEHSREILTLTPNLKYHNFQTVNTADCFQTVNTASKEWNLFPRMNASDPSPARWRRRGSRAED